MYDYSQTVKSKQSDELINTYLLRPVAGMIVRILYSTPITPNQVTIASTVAGLIAAAIYLQNDPTSTIAAGLLVTLKDLLDSADGQLARAKQLYSRRGRFLDSIGDFLVDLALFAAIGWVVFHSTGDKTTVLLAALGFAGITLRVSYHVFYQTSFLHLEDQYRLNRLTEEVTKEDLSGDRVALLLQRIFQSLYGWQDRIMLRIDFWCRHGKSDQRFLGRWYSDPLGLRVSGFVGIGTELFLLMICSVLNRLELYLYLNVILMNAVVLVSVFYRRLILAPSISSKGAL